MIVRVKTSAMKMPYESVEKEIGNLYRVTPYKETKEFCLKGCACSKCKKVHKGCKVKVKARERCTYPLEGNFGSKIRKCCGKK